MTTHPIDRPLEWDEKLVERPDGTSIRTLSAGAGPRTAILAHGYGYTADEWSVVGPTLVDAGFRVIAFDQRGHGGSTIGSEGIGTRQMAGDYGAVLAAHDVADGVLVGHSMGGFLALAFLLDGPDDERARIGACLLMATFAGDVSRDNPQNRVQIPLLKSGILQRLLGIDAIATAFTRTLVGRPFDKAMVDPFIAPFRAQNHARLVPILEAFVSENNYGRLGEIDTPCTIVVGSRDKTTPPFHTRDLHAGIAGSKLVTIPDKGHLLNWEAPDEIVAEILVLSDVVAT